MRQNVGLHVYLAPPRLRGRGRPLYVCSLHRWAHNLGNGLLNCPTARWGNGHIFHIFLPFNYYYFLILLQALTCGKRLLLCCFKHYALRTDGLGTWAMVSPNLASCPIGEEMDKLYSTSPYLPNKISADKL